MAAITIDGIPAGLLLRLAAAAAAGGRSLNGEIILHLVRSTGSPASGKGEPECRGVRARCGKGPDCRCREAGVAVAEREGWGGPAARGGEGFSRR